MPFSIVIAMPSKRFPEQGESSPPVWGLGWRYEFVLLVILLAIFTGKSFFDADKGNFLIRKSDFVLLGAALERYKTDTGSYPVSTGFSGCASAYGYSGPDWIAGLAPGYLPSLPCDPGRSESPTRQYYYKSDGKDYKLIAHHVEDCAAAKGDPLVRVDPVRDCFAYGVWTKDAVNW
jgi:hypothetical protein